MLTRPSDALKLILNEVSFLSQETISLSKALGRYLSQSLVAPIFLPPFDNSAMDGFAVRCGDINVATSDRPISLKVVGMLKAGDDVEGMRRAMPLQQGCAVRIMTGAPIPAGTDAVIPFEETLTPQGRGGHETCTIPKPVRIGENIRKAGEDVQKGTCVLDKGVRLTPRNMALLAALGFSEVSVTRLPQVALFSTGNELKALGSVLEPGQIYDSNGPTLSLALQELGLKSKILSTPQDTLQDLLNTFQAASEAEVILTMGAVSAGDFDLIPQALEKLGAKVLFHKLAIKPGKPVSSLIVFDRFVRPALLKMMGASLLFRQHYTALALHDIKATVGKEDYLRARITWKDGTFFAQLAGSQGSAHLAPLAESHALLVVPESISQIREEEKVEFEFWSETL